MTKYYAGLKIKGMPMIFVGGPILAVNAKEAAIVARLLRYEFNDILKFVKETDGTKRG